MQALRVAVDKAVYELKWYPVPLLFYSSGELSEIARALGSLVEVALEKGPDILDGVEVWGGGRPILQEGDALLGFEVVR